MKNQAEFTPHALETWAAALSVYPSQLVNRAVLEIGLSADPFPDLGKVFSACERLRRERAGTVPQDGVCRLSDTTIGAVAQALQLEI